VYYRVFSTFENTPKHTPTTSTTNFHRGSNVFWCGFGVVLFFFGKHTQTPPTTSTTKSTVVQTCFGVVLAWFCFFWKTHPNTPNHLYNKIHRGSTVVQPCFGVVWSFLEKHPNTSQPPLQHNPPLFNRVLPCITVY
jgi:hypothetical protein